MLRPASVKLLDTWEPRTVCEPATTTPWVPSPHGTHGVGSVTSRNPRRGFGHPHGTHAPRKAWVRGNQSSEPTVFWSFIFQGCAGIRSSGFGVIGVSGGYLTTCRRLDRQAGGQAGRQAGEACT